MPSQTLNINEAIYEIMDALSERDNPFYFIVGAGISYDSVPLAKDIVELCKQKIKKSNLEIFIDENIKGAEEYSFWLEKAYPQPISRQRFFRELIENKNITPANFRLAHLLAYSKLGNIVVTPNFDDFLTSALNHFNVKHIVCDHPESAFKINTEIKDIQIVHVHGTYLAYDCCNLTPEIIERNRASETTTNTMASLLDRIGESISPIVLGYSGWENDVIMTSLRKRLQSRRLPYKLYWFCYSADQVKNLPKWLINHNDVVFVVPENPTIKIENSEVLHDHFNIDSHEKLTIQKATLSAHVVLDRLVNELDLPEPEITADPISFLIRFIGGTIIEEKSKDVYFLDHVIKRLKHLQKLELDNEDKDNENINLFKNIRGFARRSKYITAAKILKELDYGNFDKITLNELIQVILSILYNIDKDSDEDYKLTLSIYNYLEGVINKAKDEESEIELNDRLILAYDLKSSIYNELGDEQNFILTIDKIIELSSDKMDPELITCLAHALYNKAVYFMQTDISEAIIRFEDFIQKFEGENNKSIKSLIMSAAIRLINIYGATQDFLNAHKYCDYLIELSDSLNLKAEPLGLLFKMNIFISEDKHAEAASILNDLEVKYNTSTNEDIQAIVIEAMTNFQSLDDSPDSILALKNKIIGLFRDSKSKKIQRQVAIAYFERAFHFYTRGDQLTAADNFVKSFEHGFTLAGVNIFYLLRKQEVQKNMIPYSMDELLAPKINDKNPFALINQAMYKIEVDNKWDEADSLISLIDNNKENIGMEEVTKWWHDLSLLGDQEGDLVLAWLVRHKLINDPDNLTLKDRIKRVTAWVVPEFMYHVINENPSI